MRANEMNTAPAPLTTQCGFRRTGVTCASLCWSNSSQAFTTGHELNYPASASEESQRTAPKRRDGGTRDRTSKLVVRPGS